MTNPQHNPLTCILEKKDFAGFLKACNEQNVNPLDVRLDGINMFSAIVICNAKSAEKIALFEKALAQFPDTQVMQACLEEKMSVTLDPRQPPKEVLAIPFIMSVLYISEAEVLLEGLLKLGVYIPANIMSDIKNTLLDHFGGSKLRIEHFFEDLGR